MAASSDKPAPSDTPINTTLDGSYGTGSSVLTIDTHLAVGHIEVRNP